MSGQNISFLKTQKFLEAYPIILFFQHNNLSIKQWLGLRIKLKNFQGIENDFLKGIENNFLKGSDLLVLKNTLIESLLHQHQFSNLENFTSLFQGPCFALGFSDFSQIQNILKTTKQTTSVILIGGIYNNQLLDHLDIAKMLELDEKVHQILITNINQSSKLHDVLSNSLQSPFTPLNQVAENFLECLALLKLKHQGTLYCL